MIIDFPKDIYSNGRDIVLLKDNNAVIESIKNFIENNVLDIPLTTNNSISARNMLLKATSNIEIRSIIFEIKDILERNINEVSNCDITYSDNGISRSINLEITLQNINNENNLPYNLVIRI